ncbi:MAG TPA: transcription-repair coupling factor, partial [Paenisporosarcina sp.]|nr:transcription-repair coupling factor [Paenisporosarcina sp.]
MEPLHQLLMKDHHINTLLADIQQGIDQQLVTGLVGGARPLFIQSIAKETERPILIVSANLLQAQRLFEDMVKLLGEEAVRLYPADELIAADLSVSSPELRAERIETLEFMHAQKQGVVITPIAGLRRHMPNLKQWRASRLETSIGQQVVLDEWLDQLVAMGYSRQAMVTAPGEFALRGGILDIYPIYLQHPVRLEFFDTEVDSIRTFSAEDQRSIEKLQEICILPATEFVWTRQQLLILAEKLEDSLASSLKKLKKSETKELLLQHMNHDIELLRQGDVPEQMTKYVSILEDHPTFLGDYFAQDGLVIFDELGRIQETTDSLEREEKDWYISLLEEGKTVHDVKLSFSFKEILAMLNQRKIYFSLFARSFSGIKLKKSIAFSCKQMQHFHGQMNLLKNEMERFEVGKFFVFILADGEERQKKVKDVLEDYDMIGHVLGEQGAPEQPGIYIVEGEMSSGFELPLQRLAVLTDEELFKQRPKKKARPQKMTNAERIKSYSEIKPG